jgi:hypothetical protein
VLFFLQSGDYATLIFTVHLLSLFGVMQITFGLSTPTNIKLVFGGWIQRMNDKDRKLLVVGVSTMF